MREIEFDVVFEAYSWREQDTEDPTIDFGMTRHNHTNVWGALTRDQLLFVHRRLTAYLNDTRTNRSFVYRMACGHDHMSPYRLSRHSRAHCKQHGFQRLVEVHGVPAHGYEEFLPEFRP